MFCKHCTHLPPALKGFRHFSLFYTPTDSTVKWISGRLSTVAIPVWSLSPLLGYFISTLSSPDSSSSDWVWLVFMTSSANPDTWFHWGRWDLRRWGTRVAKPSSPPYMIYCTCVARCEKCFYPWTSCLSSSFSVFLSFMLTKFHFLLFLLFLFFAFSLLKTSPAKGFVAVDHQWRIEITVSYRLSGLHQQTHVFSWEQCRCMSRKWQWDTWTENLPQ